jgi:hypothetical protein
MSRKFSYSDAQSFQVNHINLSALSCLQFLTLQISPLAEYAWETIIASWESKVQIARILKGMAFLKTLRSVTICVRLMALWTSAHPRASEWNDFCHSQIWRDLDLELYSTEEVPMLQEVVIRLELPDRHQLDREAEEIFEQFKADMRATMPLLYKRGVLGYGVSIE